MLQSATSVYLCYDVILHEASLWPKLWPHKYMLKRSMKPYVNERVNLLTIKVTEVIHNNNSSGLAVLYTTSHKTINPDYDLHANANDDIHIMNFQQLKKRIS